VRDLRTQTRASIYTPEPLSYSCQSRVCLTKVSCLPLSAMFKSRVCLCLSCHEPEPSCELNPYSSLVSASVCSVSVLCLPCSSHVFAMFESRVCLCLPLSASVCRVQVTRLSRVCLVQVSSACAAYTLTLPRTLTQIQTQTQTNLQRIVCGYPSGPNPPSGPNSPSGPNPRGQYCCA
jgi:hypothetical protein